MQVQFFGGSLHQRRLTVAGELQDMPQALDNPFGDHQETYMLKTYYEQDHQNAIFVLKGYTLTSDDLTRTSSDPTSLRVTDGRIHISSEPALLQVTTAV